jgi:hypothetical protein
MPYPQNEEDFLLRLLREKGVHVCQFPCPKPTGGFHYRCYIHSTEDDLPKGASVIIWNPVSYVETEDGKKKAVAIYYDTHSEAVGAAIDFALGYLREKGLKITTPSIIKAENDLR